MSLTVSVEGHFSRGFEAVRETFADNFVHRNEMGGACCAYVHGEKVVDLWGGIRNKETGRYGRWYGWGPPYGHVDVWRRCNRFADESFIVARLRYADDRFRKV